MVDKLIRGRIIEIIIVILILIITIPIWHNFEKKMSNAKLTTLDDYNLTFNIKNNSNNEQIIVNNDYNINKEYKIFLKTSKNIDPDTSLLYINNKYYNLTDFTCKKQKDNYLYTIVIDKLSAGKKTYTIKPNLSGNSVNYSYIFEENTKF